MDITKHEWSVEEMELAEVLLTTLNNNISFLTYGEVSAKMPSHPNPHFELSTPLYHIGLLCNHLDLPFISAIVITKTGKEPGSGLRPVFEECGKDIPELTNKELYERERKAIQECNRWQLLADYLGINIQMVPKGEVIYPNELYSGEGSFSEGTPKKIYVNSYERDRVARNRCIQHYAKNGRICCQICGFDFGEFYGEEYTNIIEVHHIKPLATIGKNYQVIPEKDLIPVCPNCHTALHSKVGESVKELKARLNKE